MLTARSRRSKLQAMQYHCIGAPPNASLSTEQIQLHLLMPWYSDLPVSLRNSKADERVPQSSDFPDEDIHPIAS